MENKHVESIDLTNDAIENCQEKRERIHTLIDSLNIEVLKEIIHFVENEFDE